MSRLVTYLAEIINDRLGVYTSLPTRTRRQAVRLPDLLAQRHREISHRQRTTLGDYASRLDAGGSR